LGSEKEKKLIPLIGDTLIRYGYMEQG
jgi:hypothetical protein